MVDNRVQFDAWYTKAAVVTTLEAKGVHAGFVMHVQEKAHFSQGANWTPLSQLHWLIARAALTTN